MEFIKKIILKLLKIILVNLITLLILSFIIKNVLVDGIIKEVIRNQITPNIYQTENKIDVDNITDDERVKELLETKEVQDLIDKYIDVTLDGLIDEDNIDEMKVEEDILNYLKNNKEELSQILGEEVTDDMIDTAMEQAETKEFSNLFKDTIINTSNSLTTTEKEVLKGYKTLISIKTRILLIIFIILDLLLIALIEKSYYKWLKTLSNSIISSGIFTMIMNIVTSIIIKNYNYEVDFNTQYLSKISIIIIVSGVILRIIYIIVDKIIKNKNKEGIDEYEVS